MTVELEKILFDLSEQITRELYDLNCTRKEYHEGLLTKEDLKSHLRALEKRRKKVHEIFREIMNEL
jgi:hypothetical protein